nr:MAG TPA: Terminase small subunit [Caudoviricetes sp.]
MKLTLKQQAFCDYYIENHNATQAALKAGYSKKTAYTIGAENLRKPQLKAYIEQKLKEMGRTSDDRIAQATEVMEFFTRVMRGQVKDQFDLDPTLSDRLDAAKQLQKRYGLDKVAVVGGEDGDKPVQVEPAIKIYLPDNGRGDVDADNDN